MEYSDSISGLIEDSARRDAGAFEALYSQTSAKLFAIALRICRDRAMAEDVLQETFVAIWRGATTFDPQRGDGFAWLGAIARHRALDAVRKRGRSDVPVGDEYIDRIAGIPDLHAARADYADLDALVHCLDQMEEQQRELILLAYYEGRSREELASRFAAPINTVKTWLRRGLARLRLCLEE